MNDAQEEVPTQKPSKREEHAALPDSAAGLPDGDIGPYRLLEELGRGGMGVVYRAYEKALNRDVALKVLRVGEFTSPDAAERFAREARATAALDHPNIIRVHDVGVLPDGAPYYTMDILPGQDLALAIHHHQVGLREAVEAVRQVSLGLLYAHQKGILHRDIKPQNVFLRKDRASFHNQPTVLVAAASEVHAILLDFGLAKLVDRDLVSQAEGTSAGRSIHTLTRSGEIMGTPAYMPPEQTEGAKDVDARADIYSLGATLYHAIAGRPPFDSSTLARLLDDVHTKDPAPPSRFNAEVDADLDTIVLKCLQKDPKDRYKTAAELAEDCRRSLAGEPISAHPVGFMGRLWRRAKRNRAVAIPLAGLTAALLAAAVGWGTWTAAHAFEAASARREADAILARGEAATAVELDLAERRAQRVADLEPDGTDAKARVGRARAWKSYAAGVIAADEYRVARREAGDLANQYEKARKTQEKAKRHADKTEMWDLAAEALEKGRIAQESFARAVAVFTEALGHWKDHPQAKAALAELYWERCLEAEKARSTADQEAYAALVHELQPDVYDPLLRGEKRVQVEFLLPAGVPAARLEAWLFRYVASRRPPILVPVPCDPSSGEPLAAPKLGPAEPVALRVATAGGGVGESAAVPAAEVSRLQRETAELCRQGEYAKALPALDLLTRAVPAAAGPPYHLACCLARGAAQADPYGWLVAGAGNAAVSELGARWTDPPFPISSDRSSWRAVALLALEEAVHRGWSDAAHAAADADLEPLHGEPGFALLLGVMLGEVPRRVVLVQGVVAGSQGGRAGLRAGDLLLVVRAPGEKGAPCVETVEQARDAMRARRVGEAYEVVVRRGAEQVVVAATGDGPLGVVMAQADLTPQGPTRFAWTGPTPTAPAAAVPPEVVAARNGTAFPLRLADGNRVALTADGGGARFAASLPKGSYLLFFPVGHGVVETRYPFEVARDRDWDERCVLPAEDDVPPLPPATPEDPLQYWIFVPAGPYRASGDLKAQQSPPRDQAVIRLPEEEGVEGFRLARCEATTAMYLAYLNDRSWHTTDEAFGRLPRQGEQATRGRTYFDQDATGAYRILPALVARIGWTADWPIGAISWDDAVDYCAWLTRTRGGGTWRFDLPSEDEWEKAARGPDGRFFPWGDAFDPTFCNMQVSREGEQEQERQTEPWGLFPLDESPYGVRDLAGGKAEWSRTVSGDRGQMRVLKGSSCGGPEALCRSASRDVSAPGFVYHGGGFRVRAVRSR